MKYGLRPVGPSSPASTGKSSVHGIVSFSALGGSLAGGSERPGGEKAMGAIAAATGPANPACRASMAFSFLLWRWTGPFPLHPARWRGIVPAEDKLSMSL